MNLKAELQKMNVSDLKYICKEIEIKCSLKEKNKIVSYLLQPIQDIKTYRASGSTNPQESSNYTEILPIDDTPPPSPIHIKPPGSPVGRKRPSKNLNAPKRKRRNTRQRTSQPSDNMSAFYNRLSNSSNPAIKHE